MRHRIVPTPLRRWQPWAILPMLIMALCHIFVMPVAAAEIALTGAELSIPLARQAALFEDKSGVMDLDAVVRQGGFAHLPGLLHAGRGPSAIWMKFDFANRSLEKSTRWLEIAPARLEEVSLFLPRDGRWQRIEAGSNQPYGQRPIAAPNAIFPLTLQSQQSQTVYVRVASRAPLAIEPTLWDPLAFSTAESRTRLADGLMLGGLVVMSLTAMMLLFMFRERAFLFNAFATFTFFLGELSSKGYSFMYLWPEATDWVIRGLPMYALLGVGFNLLFLRDLLLTRVHFPRIDRLLLLLLAMEWLPAPGILFTDASIWARISFPQHFPVTAIMVLVGIYAAVRKVKAARYYTAAYAILTLGSGIHGLALIGIGISPLVANYALPIGMLIANLFLLASVFDRMIEAKQEKEAAQNALLETRAVHEAQLERSVAERTADLQSALIETRQARETQSRLVAYISHDLRAPLATIINYVQLLNRHTDKETRRYQETIERSAEHQLELIDDLVEYARGELEHLELVPAPTYSHDWLADIAAQAELLAVQHQNRFALNVPPTLPPVIVFDPKRLKQVLINLLQNASKFTVGGDIRLHVKATSLPENQVAMEFSVQDTGPGIPPEDMARIFQPFERRQSPREGFGLGLSIAQKLVRAMGSQLQVESCDQGTQFSFCLTLPLADEAAVPHMMQPFAWPEPFGTDKTLLIADDDSASRNYLREILSAADFDIVCARNGDEACDIAAQRKPDVVIVDQYMPGMTGWEVMRKLRQNAVAAPVLLCSAVPPQRPAGFPEELNFDATALKPVKPEKLLETMQMLSNSTTPAKPAISATLLDKERLKTLKTYIEEGCISEIIEWADSFEAEGPAPALFARQIRESALRIDLHALADILGSAATSTGT